MSTVLKAIALSTRSPVKVGKNKSIVQFMVALKIQLENTSKTKNLETQS